MNSVKIKRVYEKIANEDTYRMLVDRLWIRGLKKKAAAIDEWNKDIAPSSELRKWYGHTPVKFKRFALLYNTELKTKPDELKRINSIAGKQNLMLLNAAKNEKINHTIVLLDALKHCNEQ